MKLRSSYFILGVLTIAVATLTACGGGGGGGSDNGGNTNPNPNPSTVTGTAATGLAINGGRVTLKCMAGVTTPPVTTAVDGSFTIDVSKVTTPCVARVDYDETGVAKKPHSLVSSAGNVNITPVTDMLVANLNNGIAADAYDKFDDDTVKGHTEERIRTETAKVKTQLAVLGVDTTKLDDDLIGTKFKAKHGDNEGDDHDAVLDVLKVRLESSNKKLEEFEHEESSGEGNKKGFATSTGAATNSANGKKLYTAQCANCHGPRISDAMNYRSTLKAIERDKGRMGFLSSSIQVAQADDIATYLAYGSSLAPSTVLPAQTITFKEPGNQTMGTTPAVLVATSDSELAVTISSSTGSVCTVTNNTTLTLMSAGTCTLIATQAGSATVAAATPVSYTFTVAASPTPVLTPQTITFKDPGTQTMGSTPAALVAASTSGLPVRLDSTTPSVCSVNGTTLTLLATGACTITASQAGNDSVAAAVTASRTFTVASAAAAAGKALYVSTNCGSCHGTTPSLLKVLNGANSPAIIDAAITNISGMNSYAGRFTTQNLDDLAAYLATPSI